MMREINLVHPHVLSVPLLLYFLVLQLLQKWSLNLLCLRCNQIQFHIFDLLQYEGQILLVYMKNDDHDHNELADDDWAAFSTKHCLAMTTNGLFFNLYLPTLFRRDIHVDVCVRGGLRVLKAKKGQEEEEAKDWHCCTSAIATA